VSQTTDLLARARARTRSFGHYWKFLVPLHVAGAFSHWPLGQRIFARMNPFLW